MRENMPLLLTESLDPARRELTHQHIETCADAASRNGRPTKRRGRSSTTLPERRRPGAGEAALPRGGLAGRGDANVVPFRRRSGVHWLAQAAAVVIIAGGALLRRPSHDAARRS